MAFQASRSSPSTSRPCRQRSARNWGSSRSAASALLTAAGEVFEKSQGGAIGSQCGLDRFVMRLNRMTHRGVRGSHVGVRGSHFRVRDSQRAERLVVGIEQGPQLPIEVGIHWSQGVGSSLSSVTQMGRRRISCFSGTRGRVFAGQAGNCTITATVGSLSAEANGTVHTFSPTALSFVDLGGPGNSVDVSGNFAYVVRRVLVYLGDRRLKAADGIDVWPLDAWRPSPAIHCGHKPSPFSSLSRHVAVV